MRLLIAIKSCERDCQNGSNQAVRDTWANYFPAVDIRFFVGRGRLDLLPDEIRVDAPDDYNGLPLKTRGIAEWAARNCYDFTFLCDTDTFVRPELLTCGFEKYDYAGYYHDRNIAGRMFTEYKDDRHQVLRNGYWWASGGVGYFLSKRACEAIAAATPTHWAEDLWVGQVLGAMHHRGQLKNAGLEAFNGIVAWHFSKRAGRDLDHKAWLREAYKYGRPVW